MHFWGKFLDFIIFFLTVIKTRFWNPFILACIPVYCKVSHTTLTRKTILNRYTVYLMELVDLIPVQWRWGCCWPQLGEQFPESLVPPQVPAAPQGQTLEHLQIQTNRLTTAYRVMLTMWVVCVGFFAPFTFVHYFALCLI